MPHARQLESRKNSSSRLIQPIHGHPRDQRGSRGNLAELNYLHQSLIQQLHSGLVYERRTKTVIDAAHVGPATVLRPADSLLYRRGCRQSGSTSR
jgi:hypothetical protein